MKRLCVKFLKIGDSIFFPNSEYEINLNPIRDGNIFLTDDRGITVDVSISILNAHFI
jgi:hypothetical protein